MLLPICAAVLSAMLFAVSSSLQHQAAAAVSSAAASRTHSFIGGLFLQPLWLVGQVLAACAFSLHAWALHKGALAVVQPIVVSGMVFAVPLRAALSHRVPSGREIRAVVLTAIGLSVFLIASNPSLSDEDPKRGLAAILTLAGVAVATACTVIASRNKIATHKAFFMGVTAGVLFGVVAGLVKLSIAEFDADGWSGLLTSWSLWTLVVLGACGVTTNLRAYRVADLSASLPALSIMNVLTSLVIGMTVFNEIPAHSPVEICLQVAAFIAIAVGLRILATLSSDEAPVEGHPSDHPAQVG